MRVSLDGARFSRMCRPRSVAEAARKLGLDVVGVHSLGRCGLPDEQQLDLSTTQGRVFVTRNRDDYIKLTVERFHGGGPHPGVIIVSHSIPNHEPGRVARALAVWEE